MVYHSSSFLVLFGPKWFIAMQEEFWEVMRGKIVKLYPIQTSQIEAKDKLTLISFFFQRFI